MHSRLTVTRGFPAGGVCRDAQDHSPCLRVPRT
jgi:hypothetical protein